jgi:DNA repair exonuclease SbcCD ATPase subunit
MIPSNTTVLVESRDQSDQSIDDNDSLSPTIEMVMSQEELGSINDTSEESVVRKQANAEEELVTWSVRTPSKQLEAVAIAQTPTSNESTKHSDQPEEVRQLLEIKENYEVEMQKYAEQFTVFKETVVQMREENVLLRDRLREFAMNSRNHASVVKDLEEEVKRWETLYFETAEMGSARMTRLEEELEHLRVSSKSSEEDAEHAKEHTKNLIKALKSTFKTSKTAQKELEEWKQKSSERESLLKEMLEKAHADKERELEVMKSKQQTEREDVQETIEDLEADLKAKCAIIERERNQASKREARLKEQIRKLESASASSKASRPGVFDSALTTVSKVIDGSFCLCSTQG